MNTRALPYAEHSRSSALPILRAFSWPRLWLQNVIRLREKRPMAFGGLLMVVAFVSAARGELEIVMSRSQGLDASSAVNNVAFYLHSAYLYALVASRLTGRSLDKVMGVIAVGVFMGVFPPILDAAFYGVGSGYYRYVTGLEKFQFSLVDPLHYSPGEAMVLWTVVALLGIYVAETTRSIGRTLLALAGSYAVVAFISAVPSSLAALCFEPGAAFPPAFMPAFLTLVQLAVAQLAYLLCKPQLMRRLGKRLIHAAPFLALVALGSSVAEWLTPSALGASARLQYTLFSALCIFQLCVTALVQNDAFDAPNDRDRGEGVPTRDDAYFFTTVAVLQVLSLVVVAGAMGAPLTLFLVASVVYSFAFYRGKHYFPTNYKCEGVWAWSSFVLGGSAQHVIAYQRTLSGGFLLASLLVFGGFSLFNVFKDYKDIRADYHARVQTLYVLARRRGVRLSRLHRHLVRIFIVALLLPPILLVVAGLPPLPVGLAAALTGVPLAWVLGGPPTKKTVLCFIAGTAAYLLGLAAVIEVYGA